MAAYFFGSLCNRHFSAKLILFNLTEAAMVSGNTTNVRLKFCCHPHQRLGTCSSVLAKVQIYTWPCLNNQTETLDVKTSLTNSNLYSINFKKKLKTINSGSLKLFSTLRNMIKNADAQTVCSI